MTKDRSEAPSYFAQPLQSHNIHVSYLPLLFCMLGLAPVFSRASAMRAMPLITSAECFLGLKEQTR